MKNTLNKIARDTNIYLKKFINKQGNSRLVPAIKYGLFPGGKKIRSKILIDIGSLLSINYKTLIAIGSAVECIHAYSLIHDDLPCMDDDKIRRGKLSTHVKFGESTAVLAGNSLQIIACEILASPGLNIKEKTKISLIKKLSECSGHLGIAGGQYLDLSYEKKKISKNKIIEMEKKKTGKLFSFCLYAVGVLANKNKKEKNLLGKLGEEIGLLFQLSDDFLDVKGSKKLIGKQIKKDNKKGKSTLINLMGFEKANDYANNLKKKILLKLEKHGKNAKDLIDTIKFIQERNF